MTTPDLSQATWRKSSRSSGNGGECVEVAHLQGAVGVRDSKNPTGPALLFTAHHWAAFHTGLKNGRFDLG
jgi:hypothetical protein